jgi:hypothetical protein
MLPFPGCQPGGPYGCVEHIYRRPVSARSPLLDSLISHWRLEEASGTRFDAHGANDLTENNTVASAVGKLGNAASFIAANQESLSIADNPSLSMGDIDFTIAGWVYLTTLDFTGLVGKWTAGTVEYLVYYDGTNLRFYVSANGTTNANLANSQVISAATWYFFVAWHDSVANSINITVNNNTPASLTHSSGVFNGTAPFYLGFNQEGLTWLNGRLDSVSVWKRVLTSAERTQLYNAGAGLDYPFV